MGEKNYWVFGGSYDSLVDAKADFEGVHAFYDDGRIGDYEVAVFEKDADGKVKIVDTKTPRRGHGAEWGLLTGSIIGLVFPVTFLLGAPLAAGTALGGIIGDWSKHFGRKDIKSMGDTLDAGQAGVVVIAEVFGDVSAKQMLSRASAVETKDIPYAGAVHDQLKEG